MKLKLQGSLNDQVPSCSYSKYFPTKFCIHNHGLFFLKSALKNEISFRPHKVWSCSWCGRNGLSKKLTFEHGLEQIENNYGKEQNKFLALQKLVILKGPNLSALLSERVHLKFCLKTGLQNKVTLEVSVSPQTYLCLAPDFWPKQGLRSGAEGGRA